MVRRSDHEIALSTIDAVSPCGGLRFANPPYELCCDGKTVTSAELAQLSDAAAAVDSAIGKSRRKNPPAQQERRRSGSKAAPKKFGYITLLKSPEPAYDPCHRARFKDIESIPNQKGQVGGIESNFAIAAHALAVFRAAGRH